MTQNEYSAWSTWSDSLAELWRDAARDLTGDDDAMADNVCLWMWHVGYDVIWC